MHYEGKKWERGEKTALNYVLYHLSCSDISRPFTQGVRSFNSVISSADQND